MLWSDYENYATAFMVPVTLLSLLLVTEAVSVYFDDTGYIWSSQGPQGWTYGSRLRYVVTTAFQGLVYLLLPGVALRSKSALVFWAAVALAYSIALFTFFIGSGALEAALTNGLE